MKDRAEAIADDILSGGDPWTRKRQSSRHDCEAHLPAVLPADVSQGDRWRCPRCRRSWGLAHNQNPDDSPWSGCFAEGVSIEGPDGSVYWRAFRTRFIGRIDLG